MAVQKASTGNVKKKTTKQDVEIFLNLFRTAQKSKNVNLIPRTEPEKQPASLGINQAKAISLLSDLRPEYYFRGPSKDHELNSNGDVWEFGMKVNDQWAYIKLKVVKSEHPKSKDIWPICLSFHKSDSAMTFPFKE